MIRVARSEPIRVVKRERASTTSDPIANSQAIQSFQVKTGKPIAWKSSFANILASAYQVRDKHSLLWAFRESREWLLLFFRSLGKLEFPPISTPHPQSTHVHNNLSNGTPVAALFNHVLWRHSIRPNRPRWRVDLYWQG
jgi:hypothetical protein